MRPFPVVCSVFKGETLMKQHKKRGTSSRTGLVGFARQTRRNAEVTPPRARF